ncbi:Druantia anti-phage system protein DruA [Chloroflexota bacterium]
MVNNLEPDIRLKIVAVLERQGYVVSGDAFSLPNQDRETKRQVHALSKAERIAQHYSFIKSNSKLIQQYMIDGKNLDVSRIQPTLVTVAPDSEWEILFRWWNLTWWSLPYERAYGRQIRFVIWDQYHKSIIGLIGLQSPILSWSARDNFLGITEEKRDLIVNQSLSAQRLGALPPYNSILGGKLVALLMSSRTVGETYKTKYEGRRTVIQNRVIPPRLLFITTTGAYGKSSVYNRLKYQGQDVAKFIGYTTGSGSFHIPDTLFDELIVFLKSKGIDTRRGYGSGPSRKLRLIDTALKQLNFKNGVNHGVKRAVYLFPFATNLKEIIESDEPPVWLNRSTEELSDFWKQRWALQRANREQSYTNFNGKDYVTTTLLDTENTVKKYNGYST